MERFSDAGSAQFDRTERTRRRSSIAAGALLISLAAACGGGGGGGGGGGPANITYSEPFAIYAKGVTIEHNVPTNGGAFTMWSITPALPTGLNFDDTTGEISGRATSLLPETDFTVTATNAGASA
jgi:hypothetical protein